MNITAILLRAKILDRFHFLLEVLAWILHRIGWQWLLFTLEARAIDAIADVHEAAVPFVSCCKG